MTFKKGIRVSPKTEFKKGHISWNKGIPCSDEVKRKISIAKTGKKTGPHSEETKRKIGLANKGKTTWIKGKHHSEKTKKKMRQSHLGHTEEKAGSWKGGQTTHNGYVYILRRNHLRANNRGYVKRALLIAEKKVGRYLKSDEIPHHKNEIKDDDRPENIKIMTAFNHKSFHSKKKREDPPEEDDK